MKNIKIEMEPPYKRDEVDYKAQITLSIQFDNEHMALKMLGDLQKLVMSYTPEAE